MQNLHRRSSHGLTLTELLISSVIVGIIMLGVVSLDSVIGKKRQIATADNLLALNTRVTVNHMLKNALQAVGYGTQEYQGILIGDQVGDQGINGPGTFCVNQDIKPLSTEVNWTPLDHSDDRWVCYTLNPTDHKIYFCEKANDVAASYRGAGRCSSGEIVGQAVSWAPKFEVDNSEGGVKLVFSISLTTRFNPAKPKSNSNPEHTVTISSSPPGHAIR